MRSDLEARRRALEDAVAAVPLVGIVRLADDAAPATTGHVRAMGEGGMTLAEVTLTTAGALDAIAALTNDPVSGLVVGCGSVRTVHDVRAAHEAGAAFLVTPTTDLEVLGAAARLGMPVIAGALTPSEADRAHQGAAAFVKLFPASLGGPRYLRELRAPLPDIRFVPTGGVTLDSVGEWFAAGATAVAIGSALVPTAERDSAAVRDRAAAFTSAARAALAARAAE